MSNGGSGTGQAGMVQVTINGQTKTMSWTDYLKLVDQNQQTADQVLQQADALPANAMVTVTNTDGTTTTMTAAQFQALATQQAAQADQAAASAHAQATQQFASVTGQAKVAVPDLQAFSAGVIDHGMAVSAVLSKLQSTASWADTAIRGTPGSGFGGVSANGTPLDPNPTSTTHQFEQFLIDASKAFDDGWPKVQDGLVKLGNNLGRVGDALSANASGWAQAEIDSAKLFGAQAPWSSPPRPSQTSIPGAVIIGPYESGARTAGGSGGAVAQMAAAFRAGANQLRQTSGTADALVATHTSQSFWVGTDRDNFLAMWRSNFGGSSAAGASVFNAQISQFAAAAQNVDSIAQLLEEVAAAYQQRRAIFLSEIVPTVVMALTFALSGPIMGLVDGLLVAPIIGVMAEAADAGAISATEVTVASVVLRTTAAVTVNGSLGFVSGGASSLGQQLVFNAVSKGESLAAAFSQVNFAAVKQAAQTGAIVFGVMSVAGAAAPFLSRFVGVPAASAVTAGVGAAAGDLTAELVMGQPVRLDQIAQDGLTTGALGGFLGTMHEPGPAVVGDPAITASQVLPDGTVQVLTSDGVITAAPGTTVTLDSGGIFHLTSPDGRTEFLLTPGENGLMKVIGGVDHTTPGPVQGDASGSEITAASGVAPVVSNDVAAARPAQQVDDLMAPVNLADSERATANTLLDSMFPSGQGDIFSGGGHGSSGPVEPVTGAEANRGPGIGAPAEAAPGLNLRPDQKGPAVGLLDQPESPATPSEPAAPAAPSSSDAPAAPAVPVSQPPAPVVIPPRTPSVPGPVALAGAPSPPAGAPSPPQIEVPGPAVGVPRLPVPARPAVVVDVPPLSTRSEVTPPVTTLPRPPAVTLPPATPGPAPVPVQPAPEPPVTLPVPPVTPAPPVTPVTPVIPLRTTPQPAPTEVPGPLPSPQQRSSVLPVTAPPEVTRPEVAPQVPPAEFPARPHLVPGGPGPQGPAAIPPPPVVPPAIATPVLSAAAPAPAAQAQPAPAPEPAPATAPPEPDAARTGAGGNELSTADGVTPIEGTTGPAPEAWGGRPVPPEGATVVRSPQGEVFVHEPSGDLAVFNPVTGWTRHTPSGSQGGFKTAPEAGTFSHGGQGFEVRGVEPKPPAAEPQAPPAEPQAPPAHEAAEAPAAVPPPEAAGSAPAAGAKKTISVFQPEGHGAGGWILEGTVDETGRATLTWAGGEEITGHFARDDQGRWTFVQDGGERTILAPGTIIREGGPDGPGVLIHGRVARPIGGDAAGSLVLTEDGRLASDATHVTLVDEDGDAVLTGSIEADGTATLHSLDSGATFRGRFSGDRTVFTESEDSPAPLENGVAALEPGTLVRTAGPEGARTVRITENGAEPISDSAVRLGTRDGDLLLEGTIEADGSVTLRSPDGSTYRGRFNAGMTAFEAAEDSPTSLENGVATLEPGTILEIEGPDGWLNLRVGKGEDGPVAELLDGEVAEGVTRLPGGFEVGHGADGAAFLGDPRRRLTPVGDGMLAFGTSHVTVTDVGGALVVSGPLHDGTSATVFDSLTEEVHTGRFTDGWTKFEAADGSFETALSPGSEIRLEGPDEVTVRRVIVSGGAARADLTFAFDKKGTNVQVVDDTGDVVLSGPMRPDGSIALFGRHTGSAFDGRFTNDWTRFETAPDSPSTLDNDAAVLTPGTVVRVVGPGGRTERVITGDGTSELTFEHVTGGLHVTIVNPEGEEVARGPMEPDGSARIYALGAGTRFAGRFNASLTEFAVTGEPEPLALPPGTVVRVEGPGGGFEMEVAAEPPAPAAPRPPELTEAELWARSRISIRLPDETEPSIDLRDPVAERRLEILQGGAVRHGIDGSGAKGMRTWGPAPQRTVRFGVPQRIGDDAAPRQVFRTLPPRPIAGQRVLGALFDVTADMTEEQFEAAAAHLLETIRQDPGWESQTLARVQEQALKMAWRVEETRRVTDGLRVAGAAGRDAMTSIVALFNDPTLDNAARQAAIRAELAKLAASPRASEIDFAAIDRAVGNLQGRASSGVLRTDASGAVTENGRPAGTVRDLLRDVTVANRLGLFNGVDVEFVVNLETPRVGGLSEVQVISRPRVPSVRPPDAPAEGLAPLRQGVTGAILEIGTGEGSFAIDMVPMAEQADALLVQTEVGSYAARAQMRRDQRFGLERVAPRSGPGSVVVLGDVLQNLELVFGTPGAGEGVARLVINNINAHYTPAQYDGLARGLLRVMAAGGQVEVQWDRSPENEDPWESRGHIQADLLWQALIDVDPTVRMDYAGTTGISYPYDVTAPGGATPGRTVPPRPDPTDPLTGRRGVIVFRQDGGEDAAAAEDEAPPQPAGGFRPDTPIRRALGIRVPAGSRRPIWVPQDAAHPISSFDPAVRDAIRQALADADTANRVFRARRASPRVRGVERLRIGAGDSLAVSQDLAIGQGAGRRSHVVRPFGPSRAFTPELRRLRQRIQYLLGDGVRWSELQAFSAEMQRRMAARFPANHPVTNAEFDALMPVHSEAEASQLFERTGVYVPVRNRNDNTSGVGGSSVTHAEKLLHEAILLDSGDQPGGAAMRAAPEGIGVSRMQCVDCRTWFRAKAVSEDRVLVVASPTAGTDVSEVTVRVFMPATEEAPTGRMIELPFRRFPAPRAGGRRRAARPAPGPAQPPDEAAGGDGAADRSARWANRVSDALDVLEIRLSKAAEVLGRMAERVTEARDSGDADRLDRLEERAFQVLEQVDRLVSGAELWLARGARLGTLKETSAAVADVLAGVKAADGELWELLRGVWRQGLLTPDALAARQEAERIELARRQSTAQEWIDLNARHQREWADVGPAMAEELAAYFDAMWDGAPEVRRVAYRTVMDVVRSDGTPTGEQVGRTAHYTVVRRPGGVTARPLTEITLRLRLSESHSDPAQVEQVRRRIEEAVDRFYNEPLFALPDGSILRVGVRFDDRPLTNTDLRLRVLPGQGRASADQVFVESHVVTIAHELGHLLGLPDEYFDQQRRMAGRQTQDSAGVFHDASLMGPSTNSDGSPRLDVTLKVRHLRKLFEDISDQSQPVPEGSLSEHGLVRYPVDEPAPVQGPEAVAARMTAVRAELQRLSDAVAADQPGNPLQVLDAVRRATSVLDAAVQGLARGWEVGVSLGEIEALEENAERALSELEPVAEQAREMARYLFRVFAVANRAVASAEDLPPALRPASTAIVAALDTRPMSRRLDALLSRADQAIIAARRALNLDGPQLGSSGPAAPPAAPDEADAAEAAGLAELTREAEAELGRQGAGPEGALAVLVAEIPGVGTAHEGRFPGGHAVARAANRVVLSVPGGHDATLEVPLPGVRVVFGGDVRDEAGGAARRPQVSAPRPAPSPGPALTGELPEGRFGNRELSFLDYLERLIGRAEDPAVPLLDRVRGLTFVSGGLDDFARVRMSRLEAGRASAPDKRSVDGLTAGEQLEAVQARVDELEARQRLLWERELLPALRAAGIEVVGLGELSAEERQQVWAQVQPDLRRVEGPLPELPRPEHLALNVGVVLASGHGLVEVPSAVPRFLGVGSKLVPVEEVIAGHLDELFPGQDVVGHYGFRVTDSRDMQVPEGPVGDLLTAMREALEEFPKTAGPVRLEIGEEAPEGIREGLASSLGLTSREVTVVRGRVNFGEVGPIAGLDRSELKSVSVRGVTPAALREAGSVMEAMSKGDILLQHPYESFADSVVKLVEEAAADARVTEIRMTVYRTSSDSPIVRSLMEAAKAGKRVDVLVELRAREDNAANVRWIGELERAGARVTQGVVGLKTHAKVLQVVRREGDVLRTYTHLGTGNYNPSTARFYEDLGLLTADPDLGADVSELFGMLTGHGEGQGFRKLLVAPQTIRTGVIEQIRQEAAAGKDGRIVLKVNNLLDPEVIDALYDASRAGARVDVIVRGMTALKPGVPGLSETVRVRSVIGGVLEHSRVFLFGTPERGTRVWIGSADMMNRNLSRRVEVLTPVEDPVQKGRLEGIVELALEDDVQSWSLGPDGTWRRVPNVRGVDAQRELQRLAARPATLGETAPQRRAPTLDDLHGPFQAMNDAVAVFIAASRATDLPVLDLAARQAEAAMSAMRDALRDAPRGSDCTGAAVAAMRATLTTSEALVQLLGSSS